jgi:hypothetical protein
MMTLNQTRRLDRPAQRGACHVALTWLVALLLATTAWAGGGPKITTLSSPGEEVTSLPVVLPDGITLVGTARELRSVILSVQGNGFASVARLDGGGLVVTLTGDYLVEFDRRALAASDVHIFFRGGSEFAGGVAQLQIGSSRAMPFSPDRIPLPLPRMAASSVVWGDQLTLDVVGAGRLGARAHVTANFGREVVSLVQRRL